VRKTGTFNNILKENEMGELADDMVNGLSCSWCGIHFKEEHGYPVICKDCFGDFVGWGTADEEKARLLKDHALQVTIVKEMGE